MSHQSAAGAPAAATTDPPAAGQETNAQSATSTQGFWDRFLDWNQKLSVVKNLTFITIATGFLGGYFQYLSAYDAKVSALAEADMKAATETFVAISNAYAEAQMLQELIFYNFAAAIETNVDPGDKALTTKAGAENFTPYTKARMALRQNSSIYAHKAEIYIDWASDLGRDPDAARVLDQDPLNEALLGAYDFDCDAEANMPRLGITGTASADEADPCRADAPPPRPAQRVNLCARRGTGQRPVTIDWQSAKHHLLTLHFCFEQSHRQIAAARVWASSNVVGEERVKAFRDNEARYRVALDKQVIRLNAFMSLTMARLERIRGKYRPSGFVCHLPLVRDAVALVSQECTPVR
ncbi:hypothetical protein SSBR45G_53990 [Bradyrhizobium sp. SSBR45G]|uniref:hypothetical protein n=1 Tax=unclassified Bradyrhizobium TaxID=2631580 RepID=UPI0023429AA5|nr:MULTISPECIES: hypothetical protein [unclassified Bradyrhizobium]GLH80490.1 hypothetical protein SSBR45G_53990 [Bradyrhizobium sp. SSBR45G]GLH87885.1 hypothetical protein SSBR45R_53450 [Bradyrhizobium sp. SSBR45R]